MSTASIRHSATVEADARATFEAFTADLGKWWPLAYTFSLGRFVDAAIEQAGGEWYECDDTGARTSWGKVREYEPNRRLVLAFGIGPNREPVPDEAASEVEVRFSEEDRNCTRVDVEHRGFDRHGDGATALRAGMDSAQGWPLILAEMRRWIRVCALSRLGITS
jgi:uncharacterized protein YndB with AHSA1/START domain